MNDFQMMSLANDIVASRRAEADRSRLVRTAHAETTTTRPSPQPRRSAGHRTTIGMLFHRVALL